MINKSLFEKYYGDGLRDGSRSFYGWVNQYVGKDTVLLSLGAGPEPKQAMKSFKGKVARVVGADIDEVVLNNSQLDEAYVIVDGVLPFPENSFDHVVSDYVLEHVDSPSRFMTEVHRVLKPGGGFFFRTPNKFHYVALVSRATPHWFHELVANRARGLTNEAHEPWPTFYRLNSRNSIRRVGSQAGFSDIELRTWEAEPSYLMFNKAAFLVGVAYERLVNRFDMLSGLRANIFGRLVK